jgi:hypothetical protein
MMPAALWSEAPRLHNGLGPDEYPAILQRGEGVLSRDQMRAAGERRNEPVNLNLTIVAADAKSFQDMAKRNPQAIIGPIKEALNYGDLDLRNAIRSA